MKVILIKQSAGYIVHSVAIILNDKFWAAVVEFVEFWYESQLWIDCYTFFYRTKLSELIQRILISIRDEKRQAGTMLEL